MSHDEQIQIMINQTMDSAISQIDKIEENAGDEPEIPENND